GEWRQSGNFVNIDLENGASLDDRWPYPAPHVCLLLLFLDRLTVRRTVLVVAVNQRVCEGVAFSYAFIFHCDGNRVGASVSVFLRFHFFVVVYLGGGLAIRR
ncbi:unnamed protein product, partial [Pylaiella littoralis]